MKDIASFYYFGAGILFSIGFWATHPDTSSSFLDGLIRIIFTTVLWPLICGLYAGSIGQ